MLSYCLAISFYYSGQMNVHQFIHPFFLCHIVTAAKVPREKPRHLAPHQHYSFSLRTTKCTILPVSSESAWSLVLRQNAQQTSRWRHLRCILVRCLQAHFSVERHQLYSELPLVNKAPYPIFIAKPKLQRKHNATTCIQYVK